MPVDSTEIPVLLLKTQSQPHDNYHDCLASSTPHSEIKQAAGHSSYVRFKPYFIPVLEHTQNVPALANLKDQLKSGELKRRYGGMVFTSQRAVEAWADVVRDAECDIGTAASSNETAKPKDDPFSDLESLTPFPLYVVGPATERALHTLSVNYQPKPASTPRQSPYSKLNASVHGAHTGNGSKLAAFILQHYNDLHSKHLFEYFEAPRLPFIPLLGMSSQNYGRKRLDRDDPRLMKKPLLFLVGEQRRDVIPKTLHDPRLGSRSILVDEVEVYRTEVMKSFEADLTEVIGRLNEDHPRSVRIAVLFTGQGSDVLLKGIDYLDPMGQPTVSATQRWWGNKSKCEGAKWVVATIGPTTRDHLISKRKFEPDVCAAQPSPESLRQGIETFLQERLAV